MKKVLEGKGNEEVEEMREKTPTLYLKNALEIKECISTSNIKTVSPVISFKGEFATRTSQEPLATVSLPELSRGYSSCQAFSLLTFPFRILR